MVKPLQEPPEWADNRHIGNGGTCWCAHCLKDDQREVEVEATDTKRLGTWMGVNWEDGFVEKVECPECGYTGQIKTKLMDTDRERTRFVKDGVAAYESALAPQEPRSTETTPTES